MMQKERIYQILNILLIAIVIALSLLLIKGCRDKAAVNSNYNAALGAVTK